MRSRTPVTRYLSALGEAGVLVLLSFWIFAPTNPEEGVIAVVVAGAAAVGLGAQTRNLHGAAHARLAWLPLVVSRVPPKLARDTGRLVHSAALAATNGVRHHGGWHRMRCTATADTPLARGRRAAILLLSSVAPNTIGLDIERDDGTLVVHQAVPAPLPHDPQWPL